MSNKYKHLVYFKTFKEYGDYDKILKSYKILFDLAKNPQTLKILTLLLPEI